MKRYLGVVMEQARFMTSELVTQPIAGYLLREHPVVSQGALIKRHSTPSDACFDVRRMSGDVQANMARFPRGEEWPIAANLLRSIWTRSIGYQGRFPAFPGTILVKAADQFSTALDQRKKMFAGRRSSNFRAYDGECHQWYLRAPSEI